MKDLQERAESFSAVVGIMPRIGGLSTGGRPSQFWFAAVSDNYFTGLGVTPARGHALHEALGLAGPRRPRPHVLDEDVWRRS